MIWTPDERDTVRIREVAAAEFCSCKYVICWLFVTQEVIFLGFSSGKRCLRELDAIVARLLKFVDEGVEFRERKKLTWR